MAGSYTVQGVARDDFKVPVDGLDWADGRHTLADRALPRRLARNGAGKDARIIDALTRDDAVIRSPMFFMPKGPKAYVFAILGAVNAAFENFRYTKEWVDGRHILLEFEAEVAGKSLKGIDRIALDEDGRMAELEVLIRPMNGLQALGEHVMRALAAGAQTSGASPSSASPSSSA